MAQNNITAVVHRSSDTSNVLARGFEDIPVAAQSTVVAVVNAMRASPSRELIVTLRRIFAGWIRQTRHRRELDELLRLGDPMFRDIDVTRDEVLRERQRPLSDFM